MSQGKILDEQPLDDDSWWQANEVAVGHPFSIRSTQGLFPTTWADLIERELGELSAGADWVRSEYNDPDRWLIIPEFGVRPADLRYEGFDLFCSSGGVDFHLLVRTARVLVRQYFRSLEEYRACSPYEDSKRGQAAQVYGAVIYHLSAAMDIREELDTQYGNAMTAAETVMEWVTDGPGAALRRSHQGSRRGGIKSGIKRRAMAVDPAAVVKAAMAQGWPDKSYGINKNLARRFGCTSARIGQILRSQGKLRNEGG